MFVIADLHGDQFAEGGTAGSRKAVIPGIGRNDDRERAMRGFECHLGAGGVEQPEGGIECFAEASVVIVVNVPGVDDDADPETAILVARMGQAGVVAGQELAESGYHVAEDSVLVRRVDEGEQAVAPVGELVAAARADSRRAQGRIEQFVKEGPQLSLHQIGPAGGTLYVQSDDDAAPGDRDEGIEDFPRLAHLLGLREELQSLHVVQPVRRRGDRAP